jgi:PAS domain S-box-containing protein
MNDNKNEQLKPTVGNICSNSLSVLQNSCFLGYQELDVNSRLVHVNRGWTDILGYTYEEVIGRPFTDFLNPTGCAVFSKILQRLNSELETSDEALELLQKDGYYLRVTLSAGIGPCLNHKERHIYCIFSELSNSIDSRKTSLANEDKYRALFHYSPDGIVIANSQSYYLDANPKFCKMLGYSLEELIGLHASDIVCPEEAQHIDPALRQITTDKEHIRVWHFRRKDGSLFDAEVTATSLPDGNLLAIIRDITEKIKTEKDLKHREAHLRTLLNTLPDLVWLKDINGVFQMCNTKFERFLGAKAHKIIGKTDYDFVARELADYFRRNDQEAIQHGQPIANEETVIYADDGHEEVLETIKTPLYTNNGECIGVLGIGRDISERKRAIDQLKENEEKLRFFIEHAPASLAMFDNEMRYIAASRRWFEDFGLSGNELIGNCHYDIFPDIPERWKEIHQRCLAGEVLKSEEDSFEREDGTIYWVKWEVRPWFLANGNIGGIVIFSSNLNAQKQLEQERVHLQKQLNLAQRMESIGRLAGGVAHDFNNMLSVILGFAELAREKVPKDDILYGNLTEIHKAALRSMDITRQLLTFASKQSIKPIILDLNEVIEQSLKMLRRLIGEDIYLLWHPNSEVWPVKMDPGQIDQILANLCINAKDAIENVGKITIETARVTLNEEYCTEHLGFTPGDFVMLAISDNGCGMDKQTRDNIFEPFFTTKSLENGTGLGLATVYGILKQNKGFIHVYSEPGAGTTFKLYFPRYHGTSEKTEAVTPITLPKGQGEIILVVDDELSILKLTQTILSSLGYLVLIAETSAEAIALAQEHASEISLLITDVIMPEMNGRDLTESIKKTQPDMQCLFMSGYTANVIAQHGVLQKGVHFLQKPFSRRDLAETVSTILKECHKE